METFQNKHAVVGCKDNRKSFDSDALNMDKNYEHLTFVVFCDMMRNKNPILTFVQL